MYSRVSITGRLHLSSLLLLFEKGSPHALCSPKWNPMCLRCVFLHFVFSTQSLRPYARIRIRHGSVADRCLDLFTLGEFFYRPIDGILVLNSWSDKTACNQNLRLRPPNVQNVNRLSSRVEYFMSNLIRPCYVLRIEFVLFCTNSTRRTELY